MNEAIISHNPHVAYKKLIARYIAIHGPHDVRCPVIEPIVAKCYLDIECYLEIMKVGFGMI